MDAVTLALAKKFTNSQKAELDERINNLQNIGRFLAIWDCTTGLPTSNPPSLPYSYKTGDYYRVDNINDTINYMPNGSQYTGVASTIQCTDSGLNAGSIFYYDGTVWKLQKAGTDLSFANIKGEPTDNTKLSNLLNSKESSSNKITAISSLSTNEQYPSAKAVYDYIQSLNGNEEVY